MINTIAIFRTGGVGDVILSTVSISIIRDYFPNVKIIWFGRKETNDLIEKSFENIDVYEVSSRYTYSENLLRIKNSAQQIDAIIDLQNSARTLILGRLAAYYFKCHYTSWHKYSMERAALVIQSRLRGRKFKFDFLSKNLPNRYESMALCTVRALAKSGFVDIDYRNYTPRFFLHVEEKDTQEDEIAICLGALFLTKALPLKEIRRIINLIVLQKKVKKIYLLGDANQKQNGTKLLSEFSSQLDVVNLCGITTLLEAAKVLRRVRYSIANDSALAHLSEAVNTPVLMFFGPTHQKFGYRPYLDKSQVLAIDLGCRPCDKNGDTKCRYNDHTCSGLLSTDHIARLLQNMSDA